MTVKRRNILLQVVGCILFMLQPILFPSKPIDGNNLFSNELLENYLANAMLIGFFYLNYYFLIPRLYFHKHYLVYSLLIVTGLFLVIAFPSFLIKMTLSLQPESLERHHIRGHHNFDHTHESLFSQFQFYFSNVDHQVFLFTSIVFFSLLLKVRSRWFATEKARQEAEINYLSSQINPHFLFNALNSIYALTIREKANDSAKSILKLSGLMRYIVTENRKDLVPLPNEINCIVDFIDFQKLRLADNIKLRCDISGNFADKQIPPLLLIPYIENAFKHGVNPDENSEISIYIHATDNDLKLEVENNMVSANNDTLSKSGYGIENTKTRLQLMYPGKHLLKITSNENFYKVTLILFF